MKELAVQVKTMLSTEIAVLAEKNHQHVMRDIRVIIDQLQKDSPNLDSGFKSSTYLAGNGKQEKCYELDYEATMIVLTGYDVVARAKVIKRWQELESASQKPGISGTLPPIVPELKSAIEIAQLFGFQGNHAYLSADRAIKKLTGISPLNLLEIELRTENNERILTPTEIGKKLGISARAVNTNLMTMGFQIKDENETWIPTEIGKDYAVLIDVGKKHNSGTPVQQLKWRENLVNKLVV